MSSERYRSGVTIPVEGQFTDANGDGITNADGVVVIRRKSDDKFFDGVGWVGTATELSMTEVNQTEAPGFWKYNFDTTVGNSIDDYVVELRDASGNAENKLEKLFWYVGAYLNIVEDLTTRVLGLNHENSVIEPLEWTGDIMTKGVIRIYDSKANALADNPVNGLIAQYNIDAPHVGNRLTKYTSTKEV